MQFGGLLPGGADLDALQSDRHVAEESLRSIDGAIGRRPGSSARYGTTSIAIGDPCARERAEQSRIEAALEELAGDRSLVVVEGSDVTVAVDDRVPEGRLGVYDLRMHNHVQPRSAQSRREFFRTALGATIASASILELAHHRAAWARGMAATAESDLFDIQRVAEGVYFAQAKPQAELNCNAAIFVNSKDVLVVDAHSKPSAAASLIAQIKKEVTPKPVRYLVNSHFHWDHTQGNRTYRSTDRKSVV